MIEYTRKDIIMDPNDPRLKEAIGKKVYSSSDVNLVLNRANECEYEMTLTQIEDVDSEPFTVMNTDGTEYDADFIIIKKEEPKPEYVPFENQKEFARAYQKFKESLKYGTFEYDLGVCGIWLKHNDAFLLVVEIWDRGVVIGDINMQTTEIEEDEYLTVHGVTEWKELLRDYTFLDGSPCGKKRY